MVFLSVKSLVLSVLATNATFNLGDTQQDSC